MIHVNPTLPPFHFKEITAKYHLCLALPPPLPRSPTNSPLCIHINISENWFLFQVRSAGARALVRGVHLIHGSEPAH